MQPKLISLIRHGTLIYTTPLYFTAEMYLWLQLKFNCTPDDGCKRRPKHVEWISIKNKWGFINIIDWWCTETQMWNYIQIVYKKIGMLFYFKNTVLLSNTKFTGHIKYVSVPQWRNVSRVFCRWCEETNYLMNYTRSFDAVNVLRPIVVQHWERESFRHIVNIITSNV
jgi:hypothetical protein